MLVSHHLREPPVWRGRGSRKSADSPNASGNERSRGNFLCALDVGSFESYSPIAHSPSKCIPLRPKYPLAWRGHITRELNKRALSHGYRTTDDGLSHLLLRGGPGACRGTLGPEFADRNPIIAKFTPPPEIGAFSGLCARPACRTLILPRYGGPIHRGQ